MPGTMSFGQLAQQRQKLMLVFPAGTVGRQRKAEQRKLAAGGWLMFGGGRTHLVMEVPLSLRSASQGFVVQGTLGLRTRC